jgi:hypothetical protein
LARDFERYATTVTAFICLAMIRIMLRRLAAIRAEKFLRDNRLKWSRWVALDRQISAQGEWGPTATQR